MEEKNENAMGVGSNPMAAKPAPQQPTVNKAPTPASENPETVQGQTNAPTPKQEPTQQKHNLEMQAPPKPRKTNFKVLIIVAVVVIIFSALGAAGYTYYKDQQAKNQSEQVSTLPVPTIPSSPTPTANPTSNWETYSNKELQFTLKLPPDMNDYESTEGPTTNQRIDFATKQPFDQNEYWIWISTSPNVNKLSADEAADNYLSAKSTFKDGKYISIEEQPDIFNKIMREKLLVGNRDAVSLYPVPLSTDAKYIYITTDNFVYTMTLQAGTASVLSNEAITIFNQILSTFQFTE